jgi:hypothetical protein
MSGHWDFILAAYGLAAAVLGGYRFWLGRQLRAAEAERAALAGREKGRP